MMSRSFNVQIRVTRHQFLRVRAANEKEAMQIVLRNKGLGFEEYLEPVDSGMEIYRCDPDEDEEVNHE